MNLDLISVMCPRLLIAYFQIKQFCVNFMICLWSWKWKGSISGIVVKDEEHFQAELSERMKRSFMLSLFCEDVSA